MLSSQLHSPHDNKTNKSSAMHDEASVPTVAKHEFRPSQEGQHNSDASYPAQQAKVQQTADSPEELMQLAVQYPKQSPYNGYRCDLVALLANLCFQCPAVQRKVQQLGGVELILSQCQVQQLLMALLACMQQSCVCCHHWSQEVLCCKTEEVCLIVHVLCEFVLAN